MTQLLTYLFGGIYTLTIVGIILVIVTDNRNPLKTVPWIVVLLFAPIVGVIFYFFFGQNLSKRRIISRRTRKRMTMHLAQNDAEAHPRIPEEHAPLAAMLAATVHAVPLRGSRITPYTTGREKMEALLEAIGRAKNHIHLQYYIISDDATGRRLRDALVLRALCGVEVRLLYDDVGSRSVKHAFFDPLRAAGARVHPFLHVQFPRFTSKVNYRNHRKIAVIDGHTGFLGGMNIADRYVAGTEWGTWRDTHFKIEGPGVAGLQAAFLSDWSATTKRRPTDERYYPPLPRLTDDILQIVPSGPFGKWRPLLQADCRAIAGARRRVWIQTPYFIPSDSLDTALQTAALGGIDVRLMLPSRSDAKAVDLATHSFLDDLLRAGVKVSFYTPGFLHSKLLIVDDTLTVIGSANMDFRSFEHNFEISAFVYDPEFNARMAAIFDDDLTHCRHIAPSEWFNRPRLRRLEESFMRVFSPLL